MFFSIIYSLYDYNTNINYLNKLIKNGKFWIHKFSKYLILIDSYICAHALWFW